MIEITKDKTVVGKSSKSDVVIKDKLVSNSHASIEINSDGSKASIL